MKADWTHAETVAWALTKIRAAANRVEDGYPGVADRLDYGQKATIVTLLGKAAGIVIGVCRELERTADQQGKETR